MNRRRVLAGVTNGLATLIAASSAVAFPWADGLMTRELSGKIGPYPIGMQIRIRDNGSLEAAHYFYVRHLVDIPLNGRLDGETLTLEGTDGGVFKLHLVSDQPTRERLTFSNATGLSGVWTNGRQSLPVTVTIEWDGTGKAERHYESVTDLSDAAYEAKVRRFVQAVIKGDRDTAAAFVFYPVRLNGPGDRRQLIRNKAALVAQWNSIFTPSILKVLRDSPAHEMFTHSGEVSLGAGAVWFNDKGLIAVNVP